MNQGDRHRLVIQAFNQHSVVLVGRHRELPGPGQLENVLSGGRSGWHFSARRSVGRIIQRRLVIQGLDSQHEQVRRLKWRAYRPFV